MYANVARSQTRSKRPYAPDSWSSIWDPWRYPNPTPSSPTQCRKLTSHHLPVQTCDYAYGSCWSLEALTASTVYSSTSWVCGFTTVLSCTPESLNWLTTWLSLHLRTNGSVGCASPANWSLAPFYLWSTNCYHSAIDWSPLVNRWSVRFRSSVTFVKCSRGPIPTFYAFSRLHAVAGGGPIGKYRFELSDP